MSESETFLRICRIIEPLNKKSRPLAPATIFAADLDFDSLTVMDLVAAIEDEFDIIMPLNMLPDLENISQVCVAVDKIVKGE